MQHFECKCFEIPGSVRLPFLCHPGSLFSPGLRYDIHPLNPHLMDADQIGQCEFPGHFGGPFFGLPLDLGPQYHLLAALVSLSKHPQIFNFYCFSAAFSDGLE